MKIINFLALWAIILGIFSTQNLLAEEDPATEAAFSKCMAELGETSRRVEVVTVPESSANNSKGHGEANTTVKQNSNSSTPSSSSTGSNTNVSGPSSTNRAE